MPDRKRKRRMRGCVKWPTERQLTFWTNVMNNVTRRQTLKRIGLVSLFSSLHLQVSCGSDRQSNRVDDWRSRRYRNSSRLKSKEISSLRWREVMDEIYADVPIAELKSCLDCERQRVAILDRISSDRGELFHRVILPRGEVAVGGKESHRTLITKVAHIKKALVFRHTDIQTWRAPSCVFLENSRCVSTTS